MDFLNKIIGEIECHAVEGIIECFKNGVSPNDTLKNKPLIYELISEYGRGPAFKECVKAFVDYGLQFEDKVLLTVLCDDAAALDVHLSKNLEAIKKRYSFDSAFTPIFEASLLHICAEHNHLSCAKVLVKHGANVNERAGVDEFGFGGHTPIFHTVNQHSNKCIDTMKYLVSQSAYLEITVKGLTWGKGYQWETFIPAVNPISYAMMGLLRQFERREESIYEIVSILLKAAYGIEYMPHNIPNAYLK